MDNRDIFSGTDQNRIAVSYGQSLLGTAISVAWLGLAIYLNAKTMEIAAGISLSGYVFAWVLHKLQFPTLAGVCFLTLANVAVFIGSSLVPPIGFIPIMHIALVGIPFIVLSWDRQRLLIVLLALLPFVLWAVSWGGGYDLFGGYEVSRKDAQYWVAPLTFLTAATFVLFEYSYFSHVVSKTHEKLTEAAELANQANQAKSAFLANMSHEIRTPMNGVIAMAEVLAHADLGPSERAMVGTIQQSAEHLLGIINDILDLSKIEAGKLALAPEPTNIEQTVNRVCHLLDKVSLEKQVQLTLYTDPSLPVSVDADPIRLQQVLMNLVSNAIKFSSDLDRIGSVCASATLDRVEGKTAHVVFTVRDNGIGMSAHDLERIFHPFEQADSSTTKRFGGTGLGLEISRQLVALMGGDITAESQPDAGATFTVRIPFPILPDDGVAEPLLLHDVECVVTGNDERVQDILSHYLECAGATVRRTETFEDGCQFIATHPDEARQVCLLVIDEPSDVTGQEIVDRMDCEIRHQQIPAVYLSYLSVERGKRRKPRRLSDKVIQVDREVMTRETALQAVAIALGRLSDQKVQEDKGEKYDKRVVSREDAIQHGQLVLVAEDNEINQEVILNQLELLGYSADIAADGVIAVKMWRAGAYALILTDLHMPNMDGYELARRIRDEEQAHGLARTPIVALTANALKTEEERCLKGGMDGYLSKPVSLDRLDREIARWVSAKDEHPKVSVTEPVTDDPSGEAAKVDRMEADAAVDPTAMVDYIGGHDPVKFKRFMSLFVEKAAPDLQKLQDALSSGDVDSVAELAHKLKSSSGSIGAKAFSELCKTAEIGAKTGTLRNEAELAERLAQEFEAVRSFVELYDGSE